MKVWSHWDQVSSNLAVRLVHERVAEIDAIEAIDVEYNGRKPSIQCLVDEDQGVDKRLSTLTLQPG